MELAALLEQARCAAPDRRIESRDRIAEYGARAIDGVRPWLADDVLSAFTVRVIERAGINGESALASKVLRSARATVPAGVSEDVAWALQHLQAAARPKPPPAAAPAPSCRFGGDLAVRLVQPARPAVIGEPPAHRRPPGGGSPRSCLERACRSDSRADRRPDLNSRTPRGALRGDCHAGKRAWPSMASQPLDLASGVVLPIVALLLGLATLAALVPHSRLNLRGLSLALSATACSASSGSGWRCSCRASRRPPRLVRSSGSRSSMSGLMRCRRSS